MNGSNMDGTDASKKQDANRKPSVRRPSRRCIFIIVAVLILCFVVCILLGVLLRPKSKDDCPKGIHCNWRSMPHSEFLTDERCDSLCTTRPCIRSAQYVLSRMDSSKDPCEDFYEFACGTYEDETILFPEQNEGVYTSQEMENEVLLNLKEIIDSIDETQRKNSLSLRLVQWLYNNCMETDQQEDVLNKQVWKQLFSENGLLPWSLINGNVRNDQKHLVEMMASTLYYDVNPFFRIKGVSMVSVNRKDYLLFRFVESESIYTLQAIYNEWNLDDEESIAAKYLFVLGKIMTEVTVDSSNLKGIVPKIIEVEKHFLELTTKAIQTYAKVYENNRHLSDEFHNHTCQDLDHIMGNIKWCELSKQIRKLYGFPNDAPVRIELPSLTDYFVAINTVLGHDFDKDIINYLGAKFMFQFMKYMPSPLREIYYEEEDLFPGRSTSMPLTARWQQCVEVVTEFFPLPLEKEYLREKLDAKARGKVHDMVKKIKETQLSLVDKMSWMKNSLKSPDPKKLIRDIKTVIGRADAVLNMDEGGLDKYYSLGFDDSADQTENSPLIPLIISVLQVMQFYRRSSSFVDVDSSNITSSRFFKSYDDLPTDGKIELSYRLLAFPMYLPGRPMYAEYANLGTTISTYIHSLLLRDIKPQNASVQTFRNTAGCLMDQLHLYKTGTVKHKGDIEDETRKEITLLVHTLGTHASFQSYADYLKQNGDEKGLPGLPFTNEQLFFISSAQAQCEKFTEEGHEQLARQRIYPARFRVNIPFSHLKEFSEAFRCPADSSMNLKRRCCVLGDGKMSRDCE